MLENVVPTADFAHFLAFTHRSAMAGGGEEGRDASAAGADLLCQRALRRQFHLLFAGQPPPVDLAVLAYVGGDDLAHLAVAQQHSQTEIIHAAIVRDHGEIANAPPADLGDEVLGYAAQPEAAGDQGHAVRNAL